MKLYVVRHGQTNYNDLELCNSDPTVDVHLTSLGTQQIQQLAQKLKNANIDHIITSELPRTKQTAAIINEYHNVPITIDARLNDNRTGFESKPYQQYHAALARAENKWTARFNGGESFEDIKKRVGNFLEELKNQDYDCVLIATSKIITQVMYGLTHGLSNQQTWDFKVEPGSCVEIERL